MMSKNLHLALLIMFVVTLTVCDTGKANSNGLEINKGKNVNVQITQTPINSIKNDKIENSSDSSNEKIYKITKQSYIDKNIKINYPQINNFSDVNKQKLINELLKNDILRILNNYKDDKKVTLTIDYNIKLKNSELLSIEYTGQESIEGYPRVNNLYYTTNIDINDVSKIRLKDIVNIDENFIKKFMSEKFTALTPEHSPIKGLNTSEVWIKFFIKSDLIETIGTENQSNTYSYLTEDTLGISVDAPHNAGDHAEFEINYQDLKDNIKNEGKIYKYLPH